MNKILKGIKRFLDTDCMHVCEAFNSFSIDRKLNEYTRYIHEVTSDPYKRDVMRAITYEEQIHQYPLQTFIENRIPPKFVEKLDIADSVGPSQIRVSLWAKPYETNRHDLINPETHFVTMNKHMDFVLSHIEQKQFPNSPEWIGSLWQNMNASRVNPYGMRVLNYYNVFSTDFLKI